MFPYADPTASAGQQGVLKRLGALDAYRELLEVQYASAARTGGSAFTRLEAFQGLKADEADQLGLEWLAFPKQVQSGPARIDRDRFVLQDEYVEWAVSVRAGGGLERVTFSTDFPEIYEALATVGVEAVIEGVRSVYPGAAPSVRDLYGIEGNPDDLDVEQRRRLLRDRLRANPWNTGDRILCLTQTNNTMFALFELLKTCGIPRSMHADAVCANVECEPARDSDPRICRAAQQLAQSQKSFSAADPVGVRILGLAGIWTLGGREIDINDLGQNEGLWKVTRNGRRGELTNRDELRMDSRKLTSGAQVSANLRVGVSVIAAPDSLLPVWARAGNEGMRQ